MLDHQGSGSFSGGAGSHCPVCGRISRAQILAMVQVHFRICTVVFSPLAAITETVQSRCAPSPDWTTDSPLRQCTVTSGIIQNNKGRSYGMSLCASSTISRFQSNCAHQWACGVPQLAMNCSSTSGWSSQWQNVMIRGNARQGLASRPISAACGSRLADNYQSEGKTCFPFPAANGCAARAA